MEHFVILKYLRVCDIVIESGRVSAQYEVMDRNGEIKTNRLIYTYNESVFDKNKVSDVNLASMMLAQVAINYGLFCEELIFEGLFDETDISFIKYMVENTSREILVNKLLIDNEFLIPPYNDLYAEQQKVYTRALLKFVIHPDHEKSPSRQKMEMDSHKYSILSSGGKDSLLSYGMIKEIGEPHPIFVNEAGRHWFTAVNAYRHLQQIEPNTARVWCNSDRIFNWMLKQLPFIRKDFASVRADIYPIRLWTVAVFLFGVIPLALKRGTGNIIIGDEYDTTVKGMVHGIHHYSALYDQSKYFDNALSRYYQRKGWNMYQYSMLRSTSELLIMKVLLKRYPELQRHQMSCHAAHEKDKRMYPCGNCEKCRRIIGMVMAMGEDPRNCGYTDQQIQKALEGFAGKKVKQIGSDAGQLFYLLLKKGLISENETSRKMGKEHAEVMKLRFDRERSNLEDLPGYVRVPVFNILKEYADGAVERAEKAWVDVVVDENYLLKKDYKVNSRNEKD